MMIDSGWAAVPRPKRNDFQRLSKSKLNCRTLIISFKQKRNDGPTAVRCEFISPSSNSTHFVEPKRSDGSTAVNGKFISPRPNISIKQKKIDGETAVNSEFNFPKRSIWFRAHRDDDVVLENADVCNQRNSASQSCSARLSLIRLATRPSLGAP